MFEWLSEITRWAVQVFPRMVVIRTTHRGVKFVWGSQLVLVDPGICWYWPVVTELELIPVVRQPITTPTQRLVTDDGKRVVAAAVVVYRISDPIKAVGQNWNVDETIEDIAAAAIAVTITKHTYNGVLVGINDQLKEACRAELTKYGVSIQSCKLTDFCPASVAALARDLQTVLFTEQISNVLAQVGYATKGCFVVYPDLFGPEPEPADSTEVFPGCSLVP